MEWLFSSPSKYLGDIWKISLEGKSLKAKTKPLLSIIYDKDISINGKEQESTEH